MAVFGGGARTNCGVRARFPFSPVNPSSCSRCQEMYPDAGLPPQIRLQLDPRLQNPLLHNGHNKAGRHLSNKCKELSGNPFKDTICTFLSLNIRTTQIPRNPRNPENPCCNPCYAGLKKQKLTTNKAKPPFETPPSSCSWPRRFRISIYVPLPSFVYHRKTKKTNATPPRSSAVTNPGGASLIAPATTMGGDVGPGSFPVPVPSPAEPVLVPFLHVHDGMG